MRSLIRENPWGTVVSSAPGGLVASHYPILLDEESEELAVLSHVGRPDEELHALGEVEMMVIVQGTHGYVSPSWYVEDDPTVPTWNFSVAHLHGVPQILSEADNLRVLERLVDRFEGRVERPRRLQPEEAARIARGTVGFRLPVSRFECKLKLSQNRHPQSRRQVMAALRRPGPYRNEQLAADMERLTAAQRGEMPR